MYNGYTIAHPPGGSGLAKWQQDPAAATTPNAQTLAGGAVAPTPSAPATMPRAPVPGAPMGGDVGQRARSMLAQRRPQPAPPAPTPLSPPPAAPPAAASPTSLAPPPPAAPAPTSLAAPAAPAFDGTGWKDNQSPQQFLQDNPFYGQTGYYGNLQQVQAQVAGHAQSAGKPTGVLGAESYTQNPAGQPTWQPAPTVQQTNAAADKWQQYVDAAGRFIDPAQLNQQYAAYQKTGALPQ